MNYRHGYKECRAVKANLDTERANAAQRKRIVRGVLIVLAIILTCVFTLALWQFYPTPAFGSTMRPVAFAPAVMNGKVVLSNCTSEVVTC